MQTYEGYFENGRFYPLKPKTQIPERRRAVVTILDEPPLNDVRSMRLAALDDFFAAIKESDEELPEFERIKFTREADL